MDCLLMQHFSASFNTVLQNAESVTDMLRKQLGSHWTVIGDMAYMEQTELETPVNNVLLILVLLSVSRMLLMILILYSLLYVWLTQVHLEKLLFICSVHSMYCSTVTILVLNSCYYAMLLLKLQFYLSACLFICQLHSCTVEIARHKKLSLSLSVLTAIFQVNMG